MGVPLSTLTPLVLVAPSERAARSASAWSESIRRLARAGSIETADAAPAGALQLLVRGEVVALPLAGLVDLTAEKARLDREIEKVRVEIAKVEAKLGNADFVSRAPEVVIAEHRERLETFQERLVRLTAARERLERV
jgi:valyl-tRNA synthetase